MCQIHLIDVVCGDIKLAQEIALNETVSTIRRYTVLGEHKNKILVLRDRQLSGTDSRQLLRMSTVDLA
jgi:hypothetical protein